MCAEDVRFEKIFLTKIGFHSVQVGIRFLHPNQEILARIALTHPTMMTRVKNLVRSLSVAFVIFRTFFLKADTSTMPSSSSSSSLLTPDEEAMALLQSGPLPRDDAAVRGGTATTSLVDALSLPKEDKLSDESDYSDSDVDEELSEADVSSGDEADASSSSPPLLNLRIKCNCSDLPSESPCPRSTNGEYLVSTPHPSTTTSSSSAPPSVSTLKLAILSALFGPTTTTSDRYLRLIVRGRLLAPDSAPLSNFALAEDDVVHAVIAPAGVRGGQQATLARGVDLSGIGSGSAKQPRDR